MDFPLLKNDKFPILRERTKYVLNGNPIMSIEMELSRNDGKFIWIRSTPSLVEIDEQKFIQILVQDITEKKKAEELLKYQAELVKNVSDAIISTDLSFKIISWNKAAENLYGWTSHDAIGKSISAIIPTSYLNNETEEEVLQLFLKNGIWQGEVVQTRIDGVKLNILSSVTYIKDIMGRPIGVVAINRNISERKKAEEELLKLNLLKSELLTRTSHELKTPLLSIKGFTELLLIQYGHSFNEDILSIIEEINNGCNRLETLVKTILKTAELESGEVNSNKLKQDLGILILACVSELNGFIKSRNQHVDLFLDDNIISIFDKEQIHDVISNLLTNAIKYTPPDGTITITAKKTESEIIISIQDTGIGLTDEEKAQIFHRFGKIERFGQGYDVLSDGSGLGLFYSKEIIELHGGKIWVSSKGRYQGSTFYFSLPHQKR